MNIKKKYRIECFKILQIYLCINNEYRVIFSDENIRFSASYPPSPESKKKFSHFCSDCSLHNDNDNTMTLDYKKKIKKDVNRDSHIASAPISQSSFFKGVRCLILASAQRKLRGYIKFL